MVVNMKVMNAHLKVDGRQEVQRLSEASGALHATIGPDADTKQFASQCRHAHLHLCVEDLYWVQATGHFHERRIQEVALKLFGLQGRGHDHQL